jgi:diadenosine tetraphosphatase ApaH/serine/threonine PP2A family protein phosphatase
LICGHTHRPWVHRVDDIIVINPGSVGNPANGDPRADYAVLTWRDSQWKVEHKAVSYDLESVFNQFHESGTLETVGAFARTNMLCRMTGIDVTLEFILYIKKVQREGSMNYEQAYSAAANSFDSKNYEKEK